MYKQVIGAGAGASGLALRVMGRDRTTMDREITPCTGSGSYLFWRDRLYRLLFAVDGEGHAPLLALHYVGAEPLGTEDKGDNEAAVPARRVQRAPWH